MFGFMNNFDFRLCKTVHEREDRQCQRIKTRRRLCGIRTGKFSPQFFSNLTPEQISTVFLSSTAHQI